VIYNHDILKEVINLCSVGDMFEINVEGDLPVKEYVCSDCDNKFKGIGKHIRCPSCQSNNVAEIK